MKFKFYVKDQFWSLSKLITKFISVYTADQALISTFFSLNRTIIIEASLKYLYELNTFYVILSFQDAELIKVKN